jgi:hypothetical protein
MFPTASADHLTTTDNEVCAALAQAALDPSHPGHSHAARILRRGHFRLLYRRNPDDLAVNPEAVRAVAEAAGRHFGAESVHYFTYQEEQAPLLFPVVQHDGRVASSPGVSAVLNRVPLVSAAFAYIAPEHREAARRWLNERRTDVLSSSAGVLS